MVFTTCHALKQVKVNVATNAESIHFIMVRKATKESKTVHTILKGIFKWTGNQCQIVYSIDFELSETSSVL